MAAPMHVAIKHVPVLIAEVDANSESVEKVGNKPCKESYQQESDRKMEFKPFTSFRPRFSAYRY
jgi:hypothetical protein